MWFIYLSMFSQLFSKVGFFYRTFLQKPRARVGRSTPAPWNWTSRWRSPDGPAFCGEKTSVKHEKSGETHMILR